MVENVCKNCNAPLDMTEAKNGVIACSFCGSVFTLPKADASDKVRKHLDAGETALDQCRFDDALASYTKAIEADGREPEGYWGRALARFRVQYLRDTVNNRLQPICHEVSEDSFTSDPDYKRALTLATEEQRAEYAKKGEEIDYIRSEFYALERTGLKYDCFICVKVTEEDGGHTEDSFAALKLYNALKKAGYKPFFSEEEMGERTGADYEALILYALKSAGSLLIVCSDKRYLETKWVKNEYTRYAAMLTDEEKERGSMAIVYLGKPIEKLPGLKGKLQGVDYRQFDAMDRIRAFIDSHDEGKRRAGAERAAKEREERERAAAERAAAEQSAIAAMQAELKRMRETLAARESGTAPAATYALSDFEIADGELVQYKGKATDVVIPAGIGITKIGKKAFQKLANLRSVTIPEGVTEICGGESDGKVWKGAFSGSGLQEVALPGSLTVLGAGAFSGCNLKSVTIPDGVTTMLANVFAECKSLRQVTLGRGIKETGFGTFQGCGLLSEVEIPPSLTDIGAMFARCTGLVRVTIPDSVKEIGGTAFSGCRSLREVTFGRNVTKIGNEAFAECAALTKVTIPDGVTEIGERTFAECAALAEVTFGRRVKTIGQGAFSHCTSLTKVTIPDSVTEIWAAAFADCAALAEVTFGRNVKTIGQNAFSKCTALTKVTIPDGVTEIGDEAFAECAALTTVTLGRNVKTIGQGAFSKCTSLKAVTIPDGVTAIGDEAFADCAALAEVTLGRGVTKIGQRAFADCTSLTKVTIPDGVTEIGKRTFAECAALAEVTFGRNVKTIGQGAFEHCTSLTKVTIPDSAAVIEWCAFAGCTALTTVAFGHGITKIEDEAFGGCTSLAEVTLPESLTAIGAFAFACNAMEEVYIPYAVETIGKCAFGKEGDLRIRCAASCPLPGWDEHWAYNGENKSFTAEVYGLGSKDLYFGFETKAFPVEWRVSADGSPLTGTDTRAFTIQGKTLVKYSGKQSKVVVPAGIEKIGDKAFSGCQAEHIELPDSVTELGKGAFSYSSFTEITIPKGVKTIPEECFRCCTGLQSIELPEGVEKIEKNAFRGYRDGSGKSDMKLASVRLPDSLREIGDAAFYGCPIQDVLIPEGVNKMGSWVFGMDERSVTVHVARKKPLFRLPDGWPLGWCANTRVKWNAKRT